MRNIWAAPSLRARTSVRRTPSHSQWHPKQPLRLAPPSPCGPLLILCLPLLIAKVRFQQHGLSGHKHSRPCVMPGGASPFKVASLLLAAMPFAPSTLGELRVSRSVLRFLRARRSAPCASGSMRCSSSHSMRLARSAFFASRAIRLSLTAKTRSRNDKKR